MKIIRTNIFENNQVADFLIGTIININYAEMIVEKLNKSLKERSQDLFKVVDDNYVLKEI